MFEINEKTIYNIIIVVYLLIGLLFVYFDRTVPEQYILLIVFFTIKIMLLNELSSKFN